MQGHLSTHMLPEQHREHHVYLFSQKQQEQLIEELMRILYEMQCKDLSWQLKLQTIEWLRSRDPAKLDRQTCLERDIPGISAFRIATTNGEAEAPTARHVSIS
jgi:hypothetical protein